MFSLARRGCLVAACLWLLGLCSGCSEPQRLTPLAHDARILAFGDSITYGTGAPAGQGYPEVLARLSGRKVVNAGVPGELTAQGLQRLPRLLQRERPQLLLLCHGGNDLLRKFSKQEIAANLGAMIELARAQGVEVVLIGVPEPKLLFMSAAELYGDLAESYDLAYLEEALPRIESDTALKADQIHPNGEGYRQLAEAIHDLLREQGAI